MSELTKISIIGPVHPYRGGIAQYTEALTKALKKKCEVYSISFKKLYPEILYPGKSDKVAPLSEAKVKNVDYILSATSPRSWSQAVKKIDSMDCDAAIIMWWTFFWQPALGYIAWRLKKKGIKVIYLCHNVTDHEENFIKRQISKMAIKVADGYILHSYEEAGKLKKIKPRANILRRVHPIYTHFPTPDRRLKKRGRLDVLYFGLIRPYKGVNVLVDAMGKLNDPKVHLSIVGEVWGAKNKEELIESIAKSKNASIDYNFEYVSEELAAEYFDRADVVVLPYLSATGSGVVTLAYHYGKPVIATAVGGLPDVVVDGKTGWLISPKAPVELARTIAGIDRKDAQAMRPHIKAYCQENSWDNMAKEVRKFLLKIN
jgi:glycosyltransferase involved in cell wall biosynthesis